MLYFYNGYFYMNYILIKIKMNKHQRVLKELLTKLSYNDDNGINYEAINFYLTYRGIKKAYYNNFDKDKFNYILRFCKKHKLYCVYQYNPRFQNSGDYYTVIISRKKIPKNILNNRFTKNNQTIKTSFHRKIGKVIGFPTYCSNGWGKKPRNELYSHQIYVKYTLKGSKKVYEQQIYYFTCDKVNMKIMKDMTKKIYNDFNKNLKSMFSLYNVKYHIEYVDGYKYKI